MTEHEEKFTAEGIPTKFLAARFRKGCTDVRIAEQLTRYPKFAPPWCRRGSSGRRSSDRDKNTPGEGGTAFLRGLTFS